MKYYLELTDMKKAISMILCLLILFSAFGGLTAAAEDDENPTESTEAPSEPVQDPSVPTEAPTQAVEEPTQNNEVVIPWQLEVPRVMIETEDKVGLSLKKADGYVDATVTIIDTDGSEIGGAAQVKVRGNSTSGPNKKPYTVKFSKKLDVLGMGKAKKWALLANMFDPTLLRNYLGIHTAAQMGLDYTSMQQVVEVWMDGAFRGCYNLIEPVQEGSTRVDIDIESNGGKKDFLIEREYNRVEEDAVYFNTNGVRFVCDEPESPDTEQLAYIKSTMDDIIATMQSGNRREIEKKIDLDSFVRYYVMNEYIKPVDFDYSSVFFYYKDGKLYAGPAWDYDLSMGNEDAAASVKYANGVKTDGVYCGNMHLYKWLSGYDWFFDRARSVYLEYKSYFENFSEDGGLIDTLAQTYAGPFERNFSPSYANWHVYAYYPNFNRKPDTSYAANLTYLKNWCAERSAWLTGYFTEDVTSYILGDADEDNTLSVLDSTMIQRKIASISVDRFDATAADTDCDGTVTVFDATSIQRKLVDFDVPYTGDRVWIKSN